MDKALSSAAVRGTRIAALLLALVAWGCATTPPKFTPVAGSGTQELRQNKETGSTYILSTLDRSRVAVEQATFEYEGLTFNLKVLTEDDRVSFGPGSVAVAQGGATRTVLGRQQLGNAVAEAHENTKGAATVAGAFAFLGAVASTLAGQPQAASNFMGHLSNSATSYQQAEADKQGLSGAISKTHLDDVTLASGEVVGGLVTIKDAEPGEPLEFRVTVGREVHTIRFENAPGN